MSASEENLAKLDLYIDGELGAEERLEFESLLADDPALERELAGRRAAMGMLAEWAEGLPAAPRRAGSRARSPLVAALAAAAALALVAGLVGLSRPDPEDRHARPQTKPKITIVDMEHGVELRESEGETELVVDPFPMKWRTLRQGVQVIPSKSGEPETLVVDPFPEEG
jgi:anti-sigma factor RsiW